MRRTILLLTLVGAMLFACAGVVLAQSTTPERTTPAGDSAKEEDKSSKEDSAKGDSNSSQPKEDSNSLIDGLAEGDAVPGEILVKLKDNPSDQVKADAHEEKGGQVKETIPKIDVDVVEVPSGQEEQKVAEYEDDPKVEFAEVNRVGQADEVEGDDKAGDATKAEDSIADYTPNDPRYSQQYQYSRIQADKAWDTTRGKNTVRIAILDTGIDNTHEDLASKLVLQKNHTDSADADDRQGHGTHVAGSATAVSNNGIGVAGTCQDCALMNGKVLNDNGGGTYDWVANGIVWATDNGAKAINMSLSFPAPSQTLELAVNYAWNNNAVVVATAGNLGNNIKRYPSGYEKAISVANTDQNDSKASSSNYGADWVDVAAPGTNILSTAPDHASQIFGSPGPKYGTIGGTSMAAPHVAGLAGLVWSKDGLCSTNTCVRQQIENNADQISGTGTYWAKGRINAQKAVGSSTTQQTTYFYGAFASPTSINYGGKTTLDGLLYTSSGLLPNKTVKVQYSTNGTNWTDYGNATYNSSGSLNGWYTANVGPVWNISPNLYWRFSYAGDSSYKAVNSQSAQVSVGAISDTYQADSVGKNQSFSTYGYIRDPEGQNSQTTVLYLYYIPGYGWYYPSGQPFASKQATHTYSPSFQDTEFRASNSLPWEGYWLALPYNTKQGRADLISYKVFEVKSSSVSSSTDTEDPRREAVEE